MFSRLSLLFFSIIFFCLESAFLIVLIIRNRYQSKVPLIWFSFKARWKEEKKNSAKFMASAMLHPLPIDGTQWQSRKMWDKEIWSEKRNEIKKFLASFYQKLMAGCWRAENVLISESVECWTGHDEGLLRGFIGIFCIFREVDGF